MLKFDKKRHLKYIFIGLGIFIFFVVLIGFLLPSEGSVDFSNDQSEPTRHILLIDECETRFMRSIKELDTQILNKVEQSDIKKLKKQRLELVRNREKECRE